VVDRHLPGLLDAPVLAHLRFVTLGMVAGMTEPDAARLAPMWTELGALDGAPPALVPDPGPIAPDRDYEDASVERASATARPVAGAEQWGVAELVLEGPDHGNPFVDVELSATFTHATAGTVTVGGFYDGEGVYRVRFQPQAPGGWRFETTSTALSLDGVQGGFEVRPPSPGNHGPVGVADRFHFAHRDGTRHLPLGTTVYALTHQPEELQERTLETLATAGFRKIRICVFPKSYLFNENEPELHPFPRLPDGGWDTTRFEPAFFRSLEQRIEQLAALGVETDLILFHAYDRWGFSELGPSADDRYVRYLVRRLAAHRTVWWSLANEYDLVLSKTTDDWERIARLIGDEDHVGHLTSIHNCFGFYDHSRPWITHVSAQRQDLYRTAENTDAWRREYGKPVVIDECAYEGDIDQGWGNISGRELVRRFWEGAVRGGYVGHGETYLNDRDELWWSKGGELVGESPERIRFLLEVLDELPGGGALDPYPAGEFDVAWGASGPVRIGYLGFGRPRYRDLALPPGQQWRVEVLDTWNCTVEALPGTFEGRFRVPLPGREHIAVRLTRVGDADAAD
jgi:hypothetical protein